MFRVGQKVVCIDGCAADDLCPALEKGRIYTVRSLPAHPILGTLGIRLHELRSNHYLGQEWAYRRSRFRPVVERKTDISIFTAMLNPAKKKRRADRPVTVS